ncbi:MAG: type II secretion system F family protein [Acetatifactor sp.]
MKTSLKPRELRRDGIRFWMILASAAVVASLAFFFYRSLWAMLPLSGVGILCLRNLLKKEKRKKKQELAAQFRECILSVATLLQAGYSAENAFLECRRDMVMLFGEDGRICMELRQIQRGLHINISLEELLMDMAKRTECEDILQFAQIFGLAKRNGGNMPEIIRDSSELIGKRIELGQEMQTLLSGKKMELDIMRVMPFGILLYVELGNPGYFQVLYHNLTGALVMTGCLGIYLTSYALGERIMNNLWAEMI